MGFDHSHYLPILKGKQGELNALQNTDPKLLNKFTPLIEIPPIPPAWPEGENQKPIPAKTIDEHIKAVAKAFTKALKGYPSLFIDGYYIELEDELENGSSPVDAIFNALRSAKVPFIPTIGLDRVEDYADSVRVAVEADQRGCCLRLIEADLESFVELSGQIDSLLELLSVPREQTDLLVDFGPRVPQKSALPFLIDALPSPEAWRTLTVASSSFPSSMMALKTNSVEELEREEWLAWLSVRSKKKATKRVPTFGDYCINHPVLTEINPKLMLMSPNIRYTDAVNYVVAKGQAQPRKKKKPTPEETAARAKLAPKVQYPILAAKIKAHPAWKGPKFSAGDEFIDRCARKECVGNATDWRAVGTCHHIALVLQQHASLP
jgi:hypothetical protein